MKTGRRFGPLLLCAGLLLTAAAVAGALFLFIGESSPAEPGGKLNTTVRGGLQALRFASLNLFEKDDRPEEFGLKYGWKDFAGVNCFALFPVSKEILAEAEDEFGYTQAELDEIVSAADVAERRAMILRLKEWARREFKTSRYAPYLILEEKDDLTFNMKFSAPADLGAAVKAEFRAIAARMETEKASELEKAKKAIRRRKAEFLVSRGLRLTPEDRIAIEYGLVVKRNRDRVRNVLQAIRDVRKDARLPDFLSLLLAFIQEIRYGQPPLADKDRFVLGFFVPPRVLVNDLGDCDSKAVAFASLWINFKRYPMILIKIPEHMFVGLAVPAWNEEGTVTINGLRYTLCEVTGPDKIPPGMITPYSRFYLESRRYLYEIVR